jgi:hypothetical protein
MSDGDWIKVYTSLPSNPDVVLLSELLDYDPASTVGWVVIFWCWVDRHMAEETIIGPSIERVLRLLGHPDPKAFADALEAVGYLERIVDPNTGAAKGFTIPQFEREFGACSKRRYRQAINSQRYRARKGPQSASKIRTMTNDDATMTGDDFASDLEQEQEQEPPPSGGDARARTRATPPTLGKKPRPRPESLERFLGYGSELPPAMRVAWRQLVEHAWAKKRPTEGAVQKWLDYGLRVSDAQGVAAACELFEGAVAANAQGIPPWAFKQAMSGEQATRAPLARKSTEELLGLEGTNARGEGS